MKQGGKSVHYYKRNIGDYAKKAARLTMLQHGAYTLLIDSCYDREQFPTLSEAIDWCWASTQEEVDAVTFVLNKFFYDENGVFVQKRIKQELDQYHKNAETNKRIAVEREAKRKEKSTKRARSVNESSTGCHEPPPNHKPLTINQEPITNNQVISEAKPQAKTKNKFDALEVDYIGLNRTAWIEWVEYRKDKRKPISKAAAKKQVNELMEFDEATQALMIDQSIKNDYTGIFPLKNQGIAKQSSPANQSAFLNGVDQSDNYIDGEVIRG